VTGAFPERVKTVLHPVFDLTAAKPVYVPLLGVPPQHDSDSRVGFERGGPAHWAGAGRGRRG
jgi:hypothetical protein